MWIAVWVPPTNLDGSFGDCIQPQVNIGGTFSCVTATAIDLGNSLTPVRQLHGHSGANSRPTRNFLH